MAVGVVIAAVVSGCSDGSTAPPIGERRAPQSPVSDLIVHDGDAVEVTGQVIAAPGDAVVFCPPVASTADPQLSVLRPGKSPSPVRPPAPTCPAALAVTLTGVDLDRLSSPVSVDGTRAGRATLRGIWHGRSIDVTEQAEPKQATPHPDGVPCPAPAGGWKADDGNTVRTRNALASYVRARPERFADIRAGYPDTTSSGNVSVMVVPVVSGELDSTQRELEAVYEGNLCVTRGVLSIAEAQRLAERVGALNNNGANFISGVALDTPNGRVVVALFMVTEHLHEQFVAIGLEKLELNPVVRPVR
ncbi:hypothetical protein ACQPXM_13315 [Kribbella sp. CA-253562]|uniref:hypothetical protein n=1 Tax=Kribbella sp. CA-253562 TaxID=3239942 RepID=UPI003D92C78F